MEATDAPTRHSFLGSRPRNKIIIEERQLKPFFRFYGRNPSSCRVRKKTQMSHSVGALLLQVFRFC